HAGDEEEPVPQAAAFDDLFRGEHGSVRLTIAAPEPGAEEVEGEGHDEQRDADGEDGLVFQAAVGQVAHGDLDDVGGHGLGAFGGGGGEAGRVAGGDGDDRGFADGAGDGEDGGGGDAGERAGEDDAESGRHAVSAHAVGTLA